MKRALGCTLDKGLHRYTPMHIARVLGVVRSISGATSADIEKYAPPVIDQTKYSCCEGASSSAATYLRYASKGLKLSFYPSVKGIYTPARCFDRGNPDGPALEDVGTQTNSVINVLSELGIRAMDMAISGNTYCDFNDENINEEPNILELEQSGEKLTIGAYQITTSGAQKLQDVKDCINSLVPIRVDSWVDSTVMEWESSHSPVGIPNYNDPDGGGHAMYIIGYQGSNVLIRNSWGLMYGLNGNFLASAAWLEQADCFAWDVKDAA